MLRRETSTAGRRAAVHALPWPDHLLTLDEWGDLPEDNRFRLEAVEGVLIVAPRRCRFTSVP
jgi:hypothetical protein